MRKLIFPLLLLTLLCIGWGPMILSTKPSADDYTDILLFATCENNDESHDADDYPTSGSWDVTGAVGFSDTANIVGVRGLDVDVSGSNGLVTWDVSTGCGTLFGCDKGRIGFYLNVQVDPSDDYGMFRLTDAGGTDWLYVIWDNSAGDEIIVDWRHDGGSEGALTTNGCDIVNTTNTFIEVAYDTTLGAGSDYVKVYKNGVLCDSRLDAEGYTAIDSADDIEVGLLANPTGDVWYDQMMVSTDPTRDLNALKALTSSPR